MDYIREWMPIQDSMKIRNEAQSARDLAQTSEKHFGARHLCSGGEILRIARITNDCVGRDPAQEKRWGGQTRRADHDVGRSGELPEIGRHLHLHSVGF